MGVADLEEICQPRPDHRPHNPDYDHEPVTKLWWTRPWTRPRPLQARTGPQAPQLRGGGGALEHPARAARGSPLRTGGPTVHPRCAHSPAHADCAEHPRHCAATCTLSAGRYVQPRVCTLATHAKGPLAGPTIGPTKAGQWADWGFFGGGSGLPGRGRGEDVVVGPAMGPTMAGQAHARLSDGGSGRGRPPDQGSQGVLPVPSRGLGPPLRVPAVRGGRCARFPAVHNRPRRLRRTPHALRSDLPRGEVT